MAAGAEADARVRSRLDGLHGLLLRLAGRLPDGLVAQARQWLAEGRSVEVAQAVVFGTIAGRVAVTEADVSLLTGVLADAGEETEAVDDVPRGTPAPILHYRLAPYDPTVSAEPGERVPYPPKPTGRYDGSGRRDPVDLALTGAVPERVPGVRALWRVWSFPDRATRWPPPRRMYLVQVIGDGGPDLPGVAAAAQAVLLAAGERDPRVEVFADPGGLPEYQRTALGRAALLWAAAPPRPIRFARDGHTTTGPGPGGDGERLDADERDRVLGYLDSGTPLLLTPDRAEDPLDRARGPVVPTNVRTDGSWIWTDAVSYHLREHGLTPEEDLLAHVRRNNHVMPEVDPVELHRARAVLDALASGESAVAGGSVPGTPFVRLFD
ncbi:hypothetical protein [Micromonospora sp. NBC_01796]|uniref:hypothetical protein n=1 Tax=Micromonospora sp. NBC_01796 TaxID=2975987 RepID=UPI002DDB0A57|nr:hypothetical protein [Micromonospora sp. NBC_01796]WSA84384.1 hypothetical protein OIE47_29090 [Micromonospora sp. NBC_01796]